MCVVGVPGELYYMREGQLNDYALSFTIPLHTNVTRVFFDWFDDSSAAETPVKLSLSSLLVYQSTVTICSLCVTVDDDCQLCNPDRTICRIP